VGHAAKRLLPEQERGSGGQRRAPEPHYLTVGRVVGVHGLQGELTVEILTDDPHRFARLDRVLVAPEGEEPVPWLLSGYRLHKGRALLRLAGCEDRPTAETFRGHLIQILREEAIPLEEGEYFEHQILGLGVWTVSGESLGEVMEIIYTGANEVYVVRGAGPGHSEILIPAIEDVVLKVDLEAGRLVVKLPEGLL
jgi:16S rRNA processing protein RimM